MTETRTMVLKTIGDRKDGELKILTFGTDDEVLELTAWVKGNPLPRLRIGQSYEFGVRRKEKDDGGEYVNLESIWQGKKAVGWNIKEAGTPPKDKSQKQLRDEPAIMPAPMGEEPEIEGIRKDIQQLNRLVNEALQLVSKAKQDNTYWEEKDKRIMRQTCIKAAAEIVAPHSKDMDETIDASIKIAKRFYDYCEKGE